MSLEFKCGKLYHNNKLVFNESGMYYHISGPLYLLDVLIMDEPMFCLQHGTGSYSVVQEFIDYIKTHDRMFVCVYTDVDSKVYHLDVKKASNFDVKRQLVDILNWHLFKLESVRSGVI